MPANYINTPLCIGLSCLLKTGHNKAQRYQKSICGRLFEVTKRHYHKKKESIYTTGCVCLLLGLCTCTQW